MARAKHQTVLVLDFGGQYNQLIARRVRDEGVYAELIPGDSSIERIRAKEPVGLILTGGPNSVYADGAPRCTPEIFEMGIPVLGICYGMQLMTVMLGGSVRSAQTKEYGKTDVELRDCALFDGIDRSTVCWMSHTDQADKLPEGFSAAATTATCPIAAIADEGRRFYGVQFHPEVQHTARGQEMLRNFLYKVCRLDGDWSMPQFVQETIEALREKVGKGRVLLALSGGVDSSVCAALLSRAVGRQLTCVFLDIGLMRKNEPEQVRAMFEGKFDMDLRFLDESEHFLTALAGVTDPERKRKIIGEQFIRAFERAAKEIGKVEFLAQGTIYPDIIESGTKTVKAVKSHHNVGGLPADLDFQLVEPLKMLFKDEVRACGTALGLPDSMVYRQPFPGPGLGVRCLGAITRDRLEAVRESDAILREEFAKAGLEGQVWQYFTVVPDFKSVGVRENIRTFEWPVILRAVNTVDAMTASVADVPFSLLQKITARITSEVKGVNRVLYDLTPKPTGTIEWE